MNQQFYPAELKAHFNLRAPKTQRPTDIFLTCTLNGKQLKLMSGVKVYPDQWSKKKHKAYVSDILCASDNQNNEMVNQKIDMLKQRFCEFKDYLCNSNEGNIPMCDLLKQFIYKDMKVEKKSE
jgi:hypothetical protein